MVLAVAYEDAKKKQTTAITPERGGDASQVPIFHFRDQPELPHASLNMQAAGRTSSTHFHVRDQFQVVINGGGSLGKHQISPYTVHFSRAYTPYGPLLASKDAGLTFFVMRAKRDMGARRISEKENMDMLKQAERDPWQISRQATFPVLEDGASNRDAVLQRIPDIEDDRGLAAYTLRMKPNAKLQAPDPADGDGQYVIVLKGSLLYENKEYRDNSVLFAGPKDDALQLHAGANGVDALVLNFPRPLTKSARVKPTLQSTPGQKKWQCLLCAFYYDEALGMPEEGIAPGTRWEDVPDSWSCPDCAASKADFEMVEVTH